MSGELSTFNSQFPRRTRCVVGLDGVPFELLKGLAGSGVMPCTPRTSPRTEPLRRIRAALPPVSSVCWSSFMTGANPGAHGIFGFTDVRPDGTLTLPTYHDLAAPTLWDRLGQAGLRSCVINQPSTYPARPLRGALVSGFVAPDLTKSIYPAALLPLLAALGYRIDVDTRRGREDPDGLLEDLEATLAIRRRATRWLWKRETWDYFQIVITETDRLHHFLWQALTDPGDPRHDRCLGFYAARR